MFSQGHQAPGQIDILHCDESTDQPLSNAVAPKSLSELTSSSDLHIETQVSYVLLCIYEYNYPKGRVLNS